MAEKYFLTHPTFELTKTEKDSDLARALSGVGLVNVYNNVHVGLNVALDKFVNNPYLQEEFIQSHAHPEIYDSFTFPPRSIHSNQYLYFDAVIALGLAACRTPGLFTGPQLYEQLLELEFEGASGKVSFAEYENRASDGVQYRIDNLLLSEKNSDALHKFFAKNVKV